MTAAGKIKIAGFNFCSQMGTDDMTLLPVRGNIKFNEHFMYPNLRFSAPEISNSQKGCAATDLYSCVLILYFLLALDQKRDPFLISHYDKSNPTAHQAELGVLPSKVNQKISHLNSDV